MAERQPSLVKGLQLGFSEGIYGGAAIYVGQRETM